MNCRGETTCRRAGAEGRRIESIERRRETCAALSADLRQRLTGARVSGLAAVPIWPIETDRDVPELQSRITALPRSTA